MQLSLASDFLLKQLVGLESVIEIKKFTSTIYYDFGIDQVGNLCYKFGYSTDDISLQVKTQYTFVDCFKDIINPTSPAWSGRDAKWYECETSRSGGELKLYDWELTPRVTVGSEPIIDFCFNFASYTDWAPNLMPYLQMGLD